VKPQGRVWLLAVGLAGCPLAMGCRTPSDVLYGPPIVTPTQDAEGRFRVTFGPQPDAVRGFTEDGRLLFRTRDVAPFGHEWMLASVPVDGGQMREEFSAYRQALISEVGAFVTDGSQRVLVAWRPPHFWSPISPGYDGCPDSAVTDQGEPGPAPRAPSPIGVTFLALGADDGASISSVPARYASSHASFFVSARYEGDDPTYTLRKRVRVTPALRDVKQTGANPFGPVILTGIGQIVYSDGEHIWVARTVDTAAPPVLLGDGAYPALSPDGHTLAYARPLGLDSTEQDFTIRLSTGVCVQTQVEITAASWEIVLRDLESGSERVLTEGQEAVFDPRAPRVVVRGPDLRWVDLSTQDVVEIPETAGAFAPAISRDGGVLAFSLIPEGATAGDIYFVRIAR
jgi:hypothetical protein